MTDETSQPSETRRDLTIAGFGYVAAFLIDAAANPLPFASAPTTGIGGAILFLSAVKGWEMWQAHGKRSAKAAEPQQPPADIPPAS